MPRPKNEAPVYKRRSGTNQARCYVNGKWVNLGVYGSPESLQKHARLCAELVNAPLPSQVVAQPTGPTIDEILLAFMKWAQVYFRREDGSTTNEIVEFKYTLQPLHKLYGLTAAKDFGPLALKAVRGEMIAADWCRTQVNKRVSKIRRVFKWAVAEGLVPESTWTALTAVEDLQRGRTQVRESEPVGPVAAAHVDATLPHLNTQVRGLVTFQRLTGCRPGEACRLRRCEIDTSDPVWLYTPKQHKTAHKGKRRVIAIGPRAQEALKPYLTDDPNAFVFDPRKATAELRATRAANRRTKLYPNAVKRAAANRRANPKRKPSSRYNTSAYATAVLRGVARTNSLLIEAAVELELHVPHWHPNQLRHTFGTEVRKAHGLEAAQVLLGHANAKISEVYAERDGALAARIAKDRG